MVGVAAVPGAPMSVAYGRNCLQNHATPFWIADFNVGMCMMPSDLDWKHVADWFREENVYVDGAYVRVDSLTLRVGDCTACTGTGEAEMDGAIGTCPLCYGGKIATIRKEDTDG